MAIMGTLWFSDHELSWELLDLSLTFSSCCQSSALRKIHSIPQLFKSSFFPITVICTHLGSQGNCFCRNSITINHRWQLRREVIVWCRLQSSHFLLARKISNSLKPKDMTRANSRSYIASLSPETTPGTTSVSTRGPVKQQRTSLWFQ